MQTLLLKFLHISSKGKMMLAIALLAGAPLTFYGMVQLSHTYSELENSTFTRGKVLKTLYIQGAYFPMVRCETVQGTIRFTDRTGAQEPEFQDGAEVEVVFPDYEPQKARISSWKRLWLTPTLSTIAGLLPLIVGIGLTIMHERKSSLS